MRWLPMDESQSCLLMRASIWQHAADAMILSSVRPVCADALANLANQNVSHLQTRRVATGDSRTSNASAVATPGH